MPVTPDVQEKIKVNNLILPEVASASNLATPASGQRGIGAVSGDILTKDSNGVSHYLHGQEQQLCVSEKLAKCTIKSAEVEVTCSGATTTATGLIPAKHSYFGAVVRVTEAITGATSFSIGDGSDADRFGATIAIAVDTVTTEASFTADPRGWSSSAINIVLTAAGSDFTGGKVRITVFYIEMDGATS